MGLSSSKISSITTMGNAKIICRILKMSASKSQLMQNLERKYAWLDFHSKRGNSTLKRTITKAS
jgi:hypothetical protein